MHVRGEKSPEGQCSLLTGASGSLSAHILAKLLTNDDVKLVYCPVRASSDEAAHDQVVKSLRTRMVYDDLGPSITKMQVLVSDLSKFDMGIDSAILAQMTKYLTSIIHFA